MSWPSKVYAATESLGVFYSVDFGGPTDPMPTWTALNDGLSSVALRAFCLDRSATPMDARMFCIDTATRTVWRRTTGTWAAVLTEAQAKIIAGTSGPEKLLSVITDPITGYVYALLQVQDGTGAFRMMRSTDHGTTWTAHTIVGNSFWYGDTNNIDAYNSLVVVNACNWPLNYKIKHSEDDGATWISVTTDGSNHSYNVMISPCDPDVWYAGTRGSIYSLVKYSTAAGDPGTVLTPSGDTIAGPYGTGGSIWFHPTNPDIFAVMNHHPVNNNFLLTLDRGITAAVSHSALGYLTQFAEHCDYQQWVQGCTGSGQAVFVSTDGYTVTDRSGTNWNTPPYTNAIPTTSGGVIARGLWSLREPTLPWSIYSCMFEQEAP